MCLSIPPVGHQQRSAGQRIARLGEEGRLQQTAYLVPVGEGLCGRCGQPYCHPGMQKECCCEVKISVSLIKRKNCRFSSLSLVFVVTYADPMNATSNQKARPCTRPECIMWNLKGISILEQRTTTRHIY